MSYTSVLRPVERGKQGFVAFDQFASIVAVGDDVRSVGGEVFEALYDLRSRFFYCFLLAAGIFLSMRREQRRSRQALVPGPIQVVLNILGVWTFFGLINIWNVRSDAPFFVRVEFFLGLFGLA